MESGGIVSKYRAHTRCHFFTQFAPIPLDSLKLVSHDTIVALTRHNQCLIKSGGITLKQKLCHLRVPLESEEAVFSLYDIKISNLSACLFVFMFYVPTTAMSFRDSNPIYCPLQRTWSSVNARRIHRMEPRISDCQLSDWLLIRKKFNDRKRSYPIL